MAETKRYYWLRLHDDFFSSVRIKKLRRMAGGDTYVIIYLKMQLRAIRSGGVLTWKGYEQDFVEELALDLDEQPDDIRVTLAYLISCGLAETEDNVNFFLPYAVENTGSETASAQRVRDFRQRKALHCNADVTDTKRECNVEKEIEKEKEKEIEIEKDNNNSFFLSNGEISENAPAETDPGEELREKVEAAMRRIAEKKNGGGGV